LFNYGDKNDTACISYKCQRVNEHFLHYPTPRSYSTCVEPHLFHLAAEGEEKFKFSNEMFHLCYKTLSLASCGDAGAGTSYDLSQVSKKTSGLTPELRWFAT
jgi:hypothetical protein